MWEKFTGGKIFGAATADDVRVCVSNSFVLNKNFNNFVIVVSTTSSDVLLPEMHVASSQF